MALLAATLLVIGVVRFIGHFEYSLLLRRQKARLRSRDTDILRGLVPDVPVLFATARTEDDVWRILETILVRGEIDSAELIAVDRADAPIASWGKQPSSGRDDDAVSARYPVGADALARAELRIPMANMGRARRVGPS